MKNTLLTIFTALLLSTGAFASHAGPGPSSTHLISGKVIDKQSGEALAGVKIQVKGADTFCYTDMNGNYVLPVSTRTEAELTIDMVGYTPLTIKTSEAAPDKELLLDPR